ncbi:MAG TPA: ATP-binding protein [Actinomycetota bacterium]
MESQTSSGYALAESIVATIREPLIVLDKEFRVRTANDAFYKTYEVAPESTQGQSLFKLGNGQWDIPALHTLLETIIPERGTFEKFEVTHPFPKIGTRTMLLNAREILSSDPNGALILLAIEDVTERRHSEELLADHARELERSNSELGQFAYVASHDLQEPLRMVASYSDLLADRYRDQLDERAHGFIEYIVDGAQRMQQLIDDLLTYARATREGESVAHVNAEEALNQALHGLQGLIQESLAVVTHDPLPVVEAPPSQLRQLFQNLIGNALKFRRDEPPRIHVSGGQEDDEWRFSVKDNGLGLDPAHADRIFLLFQRLHGRSQYAGSGMGLALCKKIVEASGGRIWVESSPGKGATFWFTLPVAKGE